VNGEVQKMLKETFLVADQNVDLHPGPGGFLPTADWDWKTYFSDPTLNGGLPAGYIKDPEELRKLTGVLAWTALGMRAAKRPGLGYLLHQQLPV